MKIVELAKVDNVVNVLTLHVIKESNIKLLENKFIYNKVTTFN